MVHFHILSLSQRTNYIPCIKMFVAKRVILPPDYCRFLLNSEKTLKNTADILAHAFSNSILEARDRWLTKFQISLVCIASSRPLGIHGETLPLKKDLRYNFAKCIVPPFCSCVNSIEKDFLNCGITMLGVKIKKKKWQQ